MFTRRITPSRKSRDLSSQPVRGAILSLLVWALVVSAGAFFLGLSTFRDLNIVAGEQVVMHHSGSASEPFPERPNTLFTRPN